MTATILLVDDEITALHNITSYLTTSGYETIGVPTLSEAKENITKGKADIFILDVHLPDGYGTDLLEEMAYMNNRPPVILITGYGDIEMAVEAMKNGAHDFLQKPLNLNQLEKSILRAEEIVSMRRELHHLRRIRQDDFNFVIGETEDMKSLVEEAQRAALASVSVLITGETGTGKEVLAREPDSPSLVPISATASVFSRYIWSHFDYNFQDKECPTEESIRDSRRTPRPVDLEAIDQFYYNHETNTFQDSDGKSIAGMSIVQEMYDKQVATVDSLRGKVFRWKIASVGKASLATQPLDRFLKGLLRILCGRTIDAPKDSFRGALTPYSQEDMKLLVTESIDVFGYRASKNVIATFCVLLQSHAPVDLVMLMLGTNDLKTRFSVLAYDISLSAGVLINTIQYSGFGPGGKAPKVLLMSPAPIGKLSHLKGLFTNGIEESYKLAGYYKKIAKLYGCHFLDVGKIRKTSDLDGLHFSESDIAKLGIEIAKTVKTTL